MIQNFIYALTAGPAASAGGMDYSFIVMMVLIFVVMYFFMIRPQQKRQKELIKFREALKKGDRVVTAGGIYGTIKNIEDTIVTLEVDQNTSIRIDKSMVLRDLSDAVQK